MQTLRCTSILFQFWAQKDGVLLAEIKNTKFIDVEITVVGSPMHYGFEGKTNQGEELFFTCVKNLPKLHLKLNDGQKIRVLNALAKETEIAVTEQTEIYLFDTTNKLKKLVHHENAYP